MNSETSKNPATPETSWTKTTFRPPDAAPCREADSATTAVHRPKHAKDMAEKET